MLMHSNFNSSETYDGPEYSGPFLHQQSHVHNHCWLEIDKTRFFQNVVSLKKLIGNTVSIAAILKSHAYGHGLCEIGSLCQVHDDITYAAVFLLSDALTLRMHGFTKPLLVLGGYDCSMKEAVEHDIDCVIYDHESLCEVVEAARFLQKKARVQIKVDTGLARLGFAPEEVPVLVEQLHQSGFVVLTGMYSHFAESDSADTSFTDLQLSTFYSVWNKLRAMKCDLPYVHMANTAASLRFERARCTMIRCGGALYGSYKDERFYQDAQKIVPDFSLKTVLTWKSRVLSVRTVPAGTPIGYARSFIAPHDMRLAIVSVGYYDGYDRRLSNAGCMVIHNKRVPIVGRVGMNMTTIDVTDITQTSVGDEVVLMGDYDGIRLKDIAQRMKVIEYEVMPPLNPAIKRIIV